MVIMINARIKSFPTNFQITLSQEPTFIPKIQIYFADFPYLHYSTQTEADSFGDLMRYLVRIELKKNQRKVVILIKF